jgi:hypothetical protein
MDRLHPGIEALLLRRLDDLRRGAVALGLGDEAARPDSSPLPRPHGFGRERHESCAEHVSPRA